MLGDGQFDRFSAARRTRRYKRTTETPEVTSPELVAEKEVIKPNLFNVETSSPVNAVDAASDRETRLQAWKERLKTQSEDVLKNNRRSRNQTSVSQDDIKKALDLAAPTSPISIANLDSAGGRANTATSYINPETSNTGRKTKEHDNDEGFEETQSLMSESPSQGASSGGNYETDLVDAAADYKKTKTTANDAVKPSKTNTKSVVNQTKTNRSFDRNSALRQTTQDIANKKSVIPRRSGSLRKTGSQNSVNNKKNNVQRSGSRNSIVSSRSSLNSATSTSTVKRLPLKVNNANVGSKPAQKTPNNKINNTNVKVANSTKRAVLPTTATQKPPRPSLSSFMKPTTSSATKTTVLPSRMQSSSFRSKH